jgi:hypothetical protein
MRSDGIIENDRRVENRTGHDRTECYNIVEDRRRQDRVVRQSSYLASGRQRAFFE